MIVSDRESFLKRDDWFNLLYQNPKAILAGVELLIETMDDAGVNRSVLCGFPWADESLCAFHNDYMAEAVRRFPDRLGWLAIVAPGRPRAVSESMRCFAAGASGIGELNADAQGFDWRDTAVLESLVDVCVQSDRPILLHASETVGHRYPGKGTATPDKLCHLLKRFPHLKVVAAHWGGGLPFLELMPEIELLTRNVVYDTAASTYLYQPRIFRTVLDLVGSERVLFGSDYPVLKMGRFLNQVRAIDWRDANEQEAVLSGNAIRVFNLSQESELTP